MPYPDSRSLVLNRILFLFLVGAYGALALVTQVVLLRQLLVSFYGSEMIVALVFCGWLAGVFLGSRIMGFINPAAGRLRAGLILLTLAWLLVLSGLLCLSYFTAALTGAAPGEIITLGAIILGAFALTTPVSFFVGALFVLAGSFWNENWPRRDRDRLGVGGTIFWVESAGSTAGLLVFSFFLAGQAGPVQVLGLFGGLVVLALIAAVPRLVSSRVFWGVGVLAVLAGFLFLGPAAWLDQAAYRARFTQAHPAYKLLAVRDTPYQHLALAERGEEKVLFGNQTFLASWPDPYYYQRLTLFFLTEAPRFERVLLAGQGPGGFIHELLRRKVRELYYLALDPAETGLVFQHLPPPMANDFSDPRLIVIHDDPRRYLAKNLDRPFDLIIINAPDPDNAQINRLYTLEFFQAAKRRMTDQGVLITSIGGAENFWSDELLNYGHSLYQTLKAVFPEVLVTPGDRNYFLAGVKPNLVTEDTELLAERYRTRGFDSPYLTPRSFPLFFPPTGTQYIKARLAEATSGRLNTDTAPLSYFLRLVLWEKMSGSGWMQSLLSWAAKARAWGPWAAAALCLPLLLVLVRPSNSRAAVTTMAVTGGVTMALQVILIFLFQNWFGVLYQGIALISALFMSGLTVGGLTGRLMVRAGVAPGRLMPLVDGCLAVLAGLTASTACGWTPGLLLPLVFLAGTFGGLEFALLFAFFMRGQSAGAVTRALSRLEAADHGGAMLGALATGLVLAPVVGLWQTAVLLGGFKLLNALVLLRAGRAYKNF